MQLIIQKEIWEKFPDFIAGVVMIKGADNSRENQATADLLRLAEHNLKEQFAAYEPFSQHPQISAWRIAYRAFGADPHQYRCSIEALVRRVLKGDQLPSINTLVDLYNYISLKYVLPAGGEDTDKIKGDLVLALACGTEEFVRLGGTENEPPDKGEVVYKDSEGVACRKWNWREADRTKLTLETANAIIVVEALAPVTAEQVRMATQELAELIKQYTGAQTESYVMAKE